MKKNVCVMGVGYVGLPMTIALSNAKNKGKFVYNVHGYDRDKNKIDNLAINAKNLKLPFSSNDKFLKNKFISSCKKNKIVFTSDFQKIKITPTSATVQIFDGNNLHGN